MSVLGAVHVGVNYTTLWVRVRVRIPVPAYARYD